MRKLVYFFSAILMLSIASCAGVGDCKDLYNKVQAGEELTQDDYSKMISYLETPLNETANLLAANATGVNVDFAKIQDKLQKIGEKYPYVQPFTQCLLLNADKLSPENLNKFTELQNKMQKKLTE